jgi:rubredoxin
MQKWRCTICDYIYDPVRGDPESGVIAGTYFEDLPDTWGCPDCGAAKQLFETYEGEYEEY